MSDTHCGDRPGGMTPERLRTHVDESLSPHDSNGEIQEQPVRFGLDRETASGMVKNSMDGQWLHEGGAGPLLGQVGPRHMIAGALLAAAGIGASVASYHSVIELGAAVDFVFHGAVFVGGVEIAYGIIRFLDG